MNLRLKMNKKGTCFKSIAGHIADSSLSVGTIVSTQNANNFTISIKQRIP